MKENGGVYTVPCKVNGVKMSFIFDTGASSVCLSKNMASFLLDNEYLNEDDFQGTTTSQVADGRIVQNLVVNIRDLEIDGLHISNVHAMVVDGQSAPLLLGQSAIQKLGRISIEGNRLIIYSASENNQLTKEQLDDLYDESWDYYTSKSYAAAIEGFLKLRENGVYTIQYYLAMSYWHNHQYSEAINAFKEYFVSDSFYNDTPETIADAYSGCANCYENLEDYRNALLYIQKAEKLFPDFSFYKYCIAYDYKALGEYDKADDYYKEAIDMQLKSLRKSIDDLKEGTIEDDLLGMYLYSYGMNLLNQNKSEEAVEVIRLSALCKDELGINFCVRNQINYSPRKKLFK